MAQPEAINGNFDVKSDFTNLAQPDFDEKLLDEGDTGEEKIGLSEDEIIEFKDLADKGWLKASKEKIEADETNGWFNCKRCNELNAIKWGMNTEEADTYGRVRADILLKKKVDTDDMSEYVRIKDQMQKNYEASKQQ